MKGFSSIAGPLFCLLLKNQPFSWSADCQWAFTTLQQALMHAPFHTPKDLTFPFFLDTDTSNVGMGAVLSQKGPCVVGYFSLIFTALLCDSTGALGSCSGCTALEVLLVWCPFYYQDKSCSTSVADVIPIT